MIALVRGVIAAIAAAVSMLNVPGSISTSTGLAPTRTHAAGGGEERIGRRDHLVARADVERHQRREHRVGAGRQADARAGIRGCRTSSRSRPSTSGPPMKRWLSQTRVTASNSAWRSGVYCAWRSSNGTVTNKPWYTPGHSLPQPDAGGRMSPHSTPYLDRIFPAAVGRRHLSTAFPSAAPTPLGLLLVLWIAAHRVRLRRRRRAAARVMPAQRLPRPPFLEIPVCTRGTLRPTRSAARTNAAPSITTRRSRASIDDSILCRGERDFPLAFFNDHARFNFTQPGQPDRRYLAFAVAWNGWWWVEPGHPHVVRACAGSDGRDRDRRIARCCALHQPRASKPSPSP